MMFGTILTSGMQMIANCGFTQRNITIVAMALSIGIGFTTTSECIREKERDKGPESEYGSGPFVCIKTG